MIWLLCIFSFLSQKSFHPDALYTSIQGSSVSSPLPSELNQPFTYLGEGSQIFAFESDDGNYVLKLFKKKHQKKTTFSRMVRHLLGKDWQQSNGKWEEKFTQTCARYQLAFSHLKEETGLIFLHFEETDPPLYTWVDKYKIDLSKIPFILQKKALLAPEYVKAHPLQKKEAEMALKEFFARRLEKGFSDPRQTLSKNYGFIGEKPIQIDVGKIDYFTGDKQAEIEKISAHVEEWISRF